MRRCAAALIVLSLVSGCGNAKAPAQLALTAAQTAVESLKGEAMKVMPDAAKGLTDSLAAAKASFDAGNYAAAMASAKDIPMQVKAVGDSVSARKSAFQAQWASMSAEMPKTIQALQARVAEIAKTKKMPAGLDAAGLANAKTTIAGLADQWKGIGAMVTGGQVADAMAKVHDMQAQVTDLMSKLGMPSAPAVAAK